MVGPQGNSIDICSDMTAPDGTVLIFGLPPNSTDEDRHSHHSDMKIRYPNLAKNLSYITTHVGGNVDPMPMFQQAMEMLSTGRIDISPIMTHRFSYRDFPEACEFASCDQHAVCIIIICNHTLYHWHDLSAVTFTTSCAR